MLTGKLSLASAVDDHCANGALVDGERGVGGQNVSMPSEDRWVKQAIRH